MPEPDPIDALALRAAVDSVPTRWRRLEVVAQAGSTNSDLAAQARAGAEPGSVLLTGYQSAGRGRLGRQWSAPPGANLAMSVLVRASRPAAEWTWLPLLTGLAAVDGIGGLTGLPVRLKWPNDVLVEGCKLGGILAEVVQTPTGPSCVIGLGVNVHLAREQLPVPTATSLTLALDGPAPGRGAVAVAVLIALDRLLARWEAGEEAGPAYRNACTTLGRVVRVERPAEVVEGVAVDVDTTGGLVLDTARGRVVCHAGDVVHVR